MVDPDRLALLKTLIQETTVSFLDELLASDELTQGEENRSQTPEGKIRLLEKKIQWDAKNFRGKNLEDWKSSPRKTVEECAQIFRAASSWVDPIHMESPEDTRQFGQSGSMSEEKLLRRRARPAQPAPGGHPAKSIIFAAISYGRESMEPKEFADIVEVLRELLADWEAESACDDEESSSKD